MDLIGSDMSFHSQEELLCQAQRGSSAAFGVLGQRYRPLLMRVLARRPVPGHETEDLVQDTLASAYAAIGSYDPSRPFAAWLTTIALHVAANHRRRRREDPVEHVERADPSPEPVDVLARQQEGHSLWIAVREALPARQYEAIQLRYVQELSVRDIASRMGITTIHVKVLLYRARRRLLSLKSFCRVFGWTVIGTHEGGES
ncbi:MAG TPA: sigma-70 family RNA polymerase sigma factor [Phycisphaerae bacterium]|nr:sigma-70 family RNA polymerase sigma factor [Phycisphaerae bacterium]HRY66598.1 sigma-70 family RNA polymerase sigma factor [Phycisphaerae bacterium]HSA27018.1 sigma-70 family RNA polymerase sigma factor [Phycisphaerae bacterium]